MEHCESIGRSAHLINLDPAAENFVHPPSKDIRDLISVDEVMEELQYGPNGGLIFALEYMLTEGLDWLQEDLGEFQDEFLIIDCPGQIEIYSHFDIMPRIIEIFLRADYRACAVYLLESQWLEDSSKFFAGVLNATAAMLQLGVPHLNLISKMDLCIDKHLSRPRGDMSASEIEEEEEKICDVLDETNPLHNFFFPNPRAVDENERRSPSNSKFSALNESLHQLIEEFDMVNFLPLNVRNESSLSAVLSHIDNATQYAENLEPKDPIDNEDFDDADGDDDYNYNDDVDDNDYESNLDNID